MLPTVPLELEGNARALGFPSSREQSRGTRVWLQLCRECSVGFFVVTARGSPFLGPPRSQPHLRLILLPFHFCCLTHALVLSFHMSNLVDILSINFVPAGPLHVALRSTGSQGRDRLEEVVIVSLLMVNLWASEDTVLMHTAGREEKR